MKPIVGIFAHPDDEAFGPAGTLATFAKEGRDVYLICVTDGNAENLAEVRREELLLSAKFLGIKHVFFLEYADGSLSNALYHEIAEKIEKLLDELQPEIIITFEPRGVTGHLDHVAVSLITTFVFKKSSSVRELWYFCLREQEQSFYTDYYIYFPPGCRDSEIDKVMDVSSTWEQRLASIAAHTSQKHDMKKLLEIRKKLPQEECFIVTRK